jgi:hypothetical protein
MRLLGQVATPHSLKARIRSLTSRRRSLFRSACGLALPALLALTLHVQPTRADDLARMFSFSGFGTFGMVHSSEHRADFTSSSLKPNGAGFTHGWSMDVDSLIAGQVTATFTPELSAVVQIMSEQNYDNTYRPHVEWANVKYQITPDLSLRGGRIVLPVFMVSDFRKVGYTFPWVRPPLEVYDLVPVDNNDGVDMSYRLQTGELTNTFQASYGQTAPTFPRGGTAKAKDAWGITYTGEYGAATVHATYRRTNLTIESYKPLFDGFRQLGPEGAAIADKYDVDSKPFTFAGVGAMYDPGDWFAMAEWGSTKSNSALGKKESWYASTGYRIQKFTPYVTYARTKAESSTSAPGLDLSMLPPPLVPVGAALNAGLNAILQAIPVQNTISAGIRWDFAKNVDLKLQFDRIRLGPNSAGVLTNVQPDFQPGGKVNVFSATLDFVF